MCVRIFGFLNNFAIQKEFWVAFDVLQNFVQQSITSLIIINFDLYLDLCLFITTQNFFETTICVVSRKVVKDSACFQHCLGIFFEKDLNVEREKISKFNKNFLT
jgi:hypothetical protein